MKRKFSAERLERFLPWMAVGLYLVYLLSALRVPEIGRPFDLTGFGRIPVLNGGRIKPLDTVGRTALLLLRGKQSARADDRPVDAIEWLADMLFRPEKADAYKVFEIDDPDVLGMIGLEQTSRFYSFQELRPYLQKIQDQATQVEQAKPEQRSRFQTAALGLQNKLILYQKLQNTVQPAGLTEVSSDYRYFFENLAPLLASHIVKGMTRDPRLRDLAEAVARYRFMSDAAEFFPLPGARGLKQDDWISVGQGLIDAMSSASIHPGVAAYAALGDSYRAGHASDFNAALAAYQTWLRSAVPKESARARYELLFNFFEPFYKSMVLYVLVFLLVAGSWLVWPKGLTRVAFALLALAFAVHTGGLVSRMVLQGRPPVTNLYSSAIFVGWMAVLLGIILERLYRNGIGSLVASVIGFLTLIIAHHLMSQGDTLEMMRAVLDSNFWLATHVVCITIGYSSTFLAGFLAAVYVIRRVFDRQWNGTKAATIDRMVYGIVCFALFFSFLGTVLGGIWADQSWGRFWGWDPKENGALMIVLWNTFILHARLGGLANQRVLMALAVFGNVVTAFSWFGVNMLGIGLHSYGFMEKTFIWLVLFAISQGLLILFGLLPDYATRRFAPSSERRP